MTRLALAPVALFTALVALPATAATLTNQSPNMDSLTVTPVGSVYFPFTHRFSVSGGKVSNSPTFTLSTGLTDWAELSGRYATSSDVNNSFNEWELLAKARYGGGERPWSVAAQAGYNGAASSVDGGVLGGYDLGPVGLRVTARGFSNFYGVGGPTFSGGAGAIWHLNPFVALSADVNDLFYTTNRTALDTQVGGALLAWSAGITADIPNSPHSLSFYVTNANTHTLEGMSRGTSALKYGFEFMIPFSNFERYAAWVGAKPAMAMPASMPMATTRVEIQDFKYGPADALIKPGTTVTWTNHDGIAHTVTADDHSFDSGMIQTGASYSHTFTQAGDVAYHCEPHPYMKGTVHVK